MRCEKTEGRINIQCYFGGTLFAGVQTNELMLMSRCRGFCLWVNHQLVAANEAAQPVQFTLFVSNYAAFDAVKTGKPGQEIFQMLEKFGVVPLAWAEKWVPRSHE